MSYDVFISHAHNDKSVADAVCATLEQQGIRCWIAPRDIQPGADWGRAIMDALKSCRAIVLIFSAAANASPQILREVERGVHQGIPVIPVRVQDVLPEGGLEYHLGTVHWLDAMTPPLEAHIHRLSDVLLLILGREVKSKAQETVPVAGSAAPTQIIHGSDALQEVEPQQSTPIGSPSAAAHAIPQPPLFSRTAIILFSLALMVAVTVGAYLSYERWFKAIDPVLVRTLTGHTSSVTSVVFSPDSRSLASGSHDNSVKLWDVASGQELHTFTGHDSYVCCVAFSPDGQLLASGDINAGTIKLWDVATGQERLQLVDAHPERHEGVNSLTFSPDGRRLAAGYNKQNVFIWDVVNGALQQTIATGQASFISAVSYSPDAQLLVSGSGDGTVKIWDAGTGNEVQKLAAGGDVHATVFSPNGRLLAVGSYGETVDLWDVSTWKKVRTLRGNTSYIHAVAFSPDGRWLISATHDNAVQVWEVSTGRLVKTLAEHKYIVLGVAFSPDGRYFASASDDKTIELWSTNGNQ